MSDMRFGNNNKRKNNNPSSRMRGYDGQASHEVMMSMPNSSDDFRDSDPYIEQAGQMGFDKRRDNNLSKVVL